MERECFVVLGQARLRGSSAEGGHSAERLHIEAQVSPNLLCLEISVRPEMPLLQRLLREILVQRPLSDFAVACEEIERRYRGPYAPAVVAAVRAIAAGARPPAEKQKPAAHSVRRLAPLSSR